MTHPALSDLEWSAVSSALNDAGRAGCAGPADGPVSRLASRLAGTVLGRGPRHEEAADPRLDAVRRFACATHSRRSAAIELEADLAAHGFNRAQIDAIALLSI